MRLSQEPGSASLYFHQYAYTAGGRKVLITTPHGLATINLQSGEIEPLVGDGAKPVMAGRRTGQVYYTQGEAVYATREIAKLPPHGNVHTVNADETLLAGTYEEPQKAEAPPLEDAPPGSRKARAESLRERFAAHIPMGMFTLNVQTGEIKTILRSTDWLNHLQFSPADPGLLMFCHEGPWEKVDRIWLIRSDGSGLTKVHERTMTMEIAGHEFWSGDGKTIWYDLQTPRSEDFWVAGYEVATGHRVRYHLERDEWSVHFNVSPDGSLFAGDGGDKGMVAHASGGKWIYLFHPQLIPNSGLDKPELIQSGKFTAERLVNMANHDYTLEPNVTFTPDMKWLVFRSNMEGQTGVYAVEIKK